MTQAKMDFHDLPDDPAGKLEKDVVWWFVSRMRTRRDAEEILQLACRSLTVAGCLSDNRPASVKIRTALAGITEAAASWDEPGATNADTLSLWDVLDTQIVRFLQDTPRWDKAAHLHRARLLLSALREAYPIQKMANSALGT